MTELYQRLIRQSTITTVAILLPERELYQRLIRQSTITKTACDNG